MIDSRLSFGTRYGANLKTFIRKNPRSEFSKKAKALEKEFSKDGRNNLELELDSRQVTKNGEKHSRILLKHDDFNRKPTIVEKSSTTMTDDQLNKKVVEDIKPSTVYAEDDLFKEIPNFNPTPPGPEFTTLTVTHNTMKSKINRITGIFHKTSA